MKKSEDELDKWTKQRLLSNVVTEREIEHWERKEVMEKFGGDWDRFYRHSEDFKFCRQVDPTENYPYSH